MKKKRNSRVRLPDGFRGQIMHVLPRALVEMLRVHPIAGELYPTDIGFFPSASYHYREREEGAMEHILILCTKGRGWVELGGVHHAISPGDMVLIPLGVPHRYGADDANPWTIHWVHLEGEDTLYYQRHLPVAPTRVPARALQEAVSIFGQVFQRLKSGYSPERLLYASHLLRHLLGLLLFSCKASVQTETQSFQEEKIREVIKQLERRVGEMVALSEMAQQAGLSVSRFSEIFKRETGLSPIDYFLHLKMQKACRLLLYTDERIQAIARELGYQDPFYFSRAFTRCMGIGPRAYRQGKSSPNGGTLKGKPDTLR